MTKQETARWLSEIYAAVADGKRLQVRTIRSGWRNADMHDGYPDMHSTPDNWRIRPEPREFVGLVISTRVDNQPEIILPSDWEPGTRVRVVEVLEDE